MLDACKMSRKRHREERPPADKARRLVQYTASRTGFRWTYKQFLHYVPRLVNVVTVCHSCSPRVPLLPPCPLACHVRRPQLAEALPMKGSGISLPLDLASIAARCKGRTTRLVALLLYVARRFTHAFLHHADMLLCPTQVQLAYSNPRCRVLVFRELSDSNAVSVPPAMPPQSC